MLVIPLLVAITRTGAKSLSMARFSHEKHSTIRRRSEEKRGGKSVLLAKKS
jgi:hypothetical protein